MDEYISREAVINITAETGAWETQNRVKELPAADVQPVRHGHWINKGYYSICSVCGDSSGTQFDGVEPIPKQTPFCGGCGAKMDGDNNLD